MPECHLMRLMTGKALFTFNNTAMHHTDVQRTRQRRCLVRRMSGCTSSCGAC